MRRLAQLLSLTLLFLSFEAAGQKQRRPLAMQLSVFNHSIAVPFHKIIATPVHPGIQAVIESRYFETEKSKLFQTLALGGFHNNYNGNGFYLNTEFAYRYKTKYFFAEAMAGGGYLRMYHPVDIYALNGAGTYERIKDKGFSSPLVSFAIGLGYDIQSSSKFSFSPFIRYQSLIQTRYRPDLNVLPQCAFHVGVRLNLKRS